MAHDGPPGTISEFFRKMARPAGFEPATLGLEGRGSRFVSSRRSRPLISACPPPWDEAVTPLGVRALVPSGGDAGEVTRGSSTRTRVFPSSGAVRVVGHDGILTRMIAMFPTPTRSVRWRPARQAWRRPRWPRAQSDGCPLGTIEMARRQLPVSIVAANARADTRGLSRCPRTFLLELVERHIDQPGTDHPWLCLRRLLRGKFRTHAVLL